MNIYVQTTATAVYTARTRLIMSAWGSHTLGNLALITDGLSPKHNADLIGQYSNLPIIEMIGEHKLKNLAEFRLLELNEMLQFI